MRVRRLVRHVPFLWGIILGIVCCWGAREAWRFMEPQLERLSLPQPAPTITWSAPTPPITTSVVSTAPSIFSSGSSLTWVSADENQHVIFTQPVEFRGGIVYVASIANVGS